MMPEPDGSVTLDKEAASVWTGLSRRLTSALGLNQSTPRRGSSNGAAAPTENDSPLQISDRDDRVNLSKGLTATSSPKLKRTGSTQERQATTRRTRNGALRSTLGPGKSGTQGSPQQGSKTSDTVVQVSHVNETSPEIPRAAKRVKRTAGGDYQVVNNASALDQAVSTVASSAGTTVEASPRHIEMPLDPGRRSIGVQLPEVAEAPSSRPRESESSPAAPKSSPRSSKNNSNGKKLGRPNGIHRNGKKAATGGGGERIYDVDFDDGPEQGQTLPTVGDKASSKQAMKTVDGAAAHDIQENSVQEGTLAPPLPKKRGRPKKQTREESAVGDAGRSSTRVLRSVSLQPEEGSIPGRKKVRKSRTPQNTVRTTIEVAEKGSEAEGNESDGSYGSGEDQSNPGDQAGADAGEESHTKEDNPSPKTAHGSSKEVTKPPVTALLGQEDLWNRILKAVGKNYPDPNGDVVREKKILCLTKAIRILCWDADRTRRQYTQLLEEKSDIAAQEEVEKRLDQELSALQKRIESIKEHDKSENGTIKVRPQGHKMIRDIYIRAVPEMIYMLRAAANYYFNRQDDGYDVASITKVIGIQNMILHLCDTAKQWKQKPVISDGRPIVKNIKKVVYPLLRSNIRKAFDAKLKELWLAEKRKENLAQTRMQSAQSIESSQNEARLEPERKTQLLRGLAEHIRQNQKEHRARLFGMTSEPDEGRTASVHLLHPSKLPGRQDAQWTRAEVKELLVQLQNRKTCHLPPDERYLEILTTPLLQNKLPDHIRQKALEYKPILMETLGEADYICSIA